MRAFAEKSIHMLGVLCLYMSVICVGAVIYFVSVYLGRKNRGMPEGSFDYYIIT